MIGTRHPSARVSAQALGWVLIGVAALAVCGCATTRAPTDSTTPLDQSASDVGLIQLTAPQVLLGAQAAPYAPLARCATIQREIAILNEALGPDLDAPETEGSTADSASGVASDLIGGLIPYRSIVRRLSGAAARQEDLERAVMAGVARRGFLRGLARERRCPKAKILAVRP